VQKCQSIGHSNLCQPRFDRAHSNLYGNIYTKLPASLRRESDNDLAHFSTRQVNKLALLLPSCRLVRHRFGNLALGWQSGKHLLHLRQRLDEVEPTNSIFRSLFLVKAGVIF
jgi:hypothetical protein